MKYKSVSYQEIINNKSSLSSSQYKEIITSNKQLKRVEYFLKESLGKKHLGSEIGSKSYIKQSTHKFMRTKALQKHSFIPTFSKEALLPMLPSEFVGKGIKKGDLLISKDSNIGEVVLADKDYPNVMLSGAIYNLPVKDEYKKYVFALLKHEVFKEQLDILVPKGATIRHAKTLFLDCLIPFPTKQEIDIIDKIVSAVVEMESKIEILFRESIKKIDAELDSSVNTENQFSFSNPKYSNLIDKNRLDTGIYNEKYKKIIHKIKNYSEGCLTFEELDMTLSRGQNLQVSNIGKSVYTTTQVDNFYTLILPKYISKYGTVNKISYLGNANKLKVLEKGDLIFGAEGFEKGRSIVIIDNLKKAITNIHGITIKQNKKHDLKKGIFLKQMLDYYRHYGLIDMIAVGGNGGSFGQKYWDDIVIPKFSEDKKRKIGKLYYNVEHNDTLHLSEIASDKWDENFENFMYDAGILNLENKIKQMKEYLNIYIDEMINN